jgi:hypothetical protein
MLKKLQKFTTLTRQQKYIFIQAWFMLAWFRAAILCVSFKRLARTFEHHPLPSQFQALNNKQLDLATSIGKLVASAARFTPWQSRCLVQVLVTQRLLAKHNIGGQFYLGVRKGSEDGSSDGGLSAHAWLLCDKVVVNGAAGHEAFAVVSSFSWQ